jgi:hypothetical protein
MFARFRTTPHRIQVSVLETRRNAGKVTNVSTAVRNWLKTSGLKL